MPLLDLLADPTAFKFDSKTRKFGMDMPGGGDSGQPYVKFPLPEAASPEYLEFYQNNRDNLDYPLRGGGFNLGFDGPYISQAAKYDRERIKKFLKDAPRGPIFILKQIGLQLSNPKIQVGSQINLDLGVLPFRFLGNLENTRIYNGGRNTLAQVGVEGSGIHFDRHGNVPINPYQQTYNYVANDTNNQDSVSQGVPLTNRLYALYQTKILTNSRISLNDQAVSIATLNTLGISRNPNLLFQYPGGPSSIGGIGLTTVHRRYSSIDEYKVIPTTPSSKANGEITGYLSYISSSASRVANAYSEGIIGTAFAPQVSQYNIPNILNPSSPPIQAQVVIPIPNYWDNHAGGYELGGVRGDLKRFPDYNTGTTDTVKQVANQGSARGTVSPRNFNYTYNYAMLANDGNTRAIGQSIITPDFRRAVVETNTDFKNKLAATADYADKNNIANKYSIGTPGTNQLKRVSYNQSVNSADVPITSTQDAINMLDVGKDEGNDLITFRFDTMEVDSLASTPLVFRAFLTGLQDNNSANYNPFKYVGRGETFYAYDGFTRTIAFNFKVAPQTRAEMRPLYRKVNYLLSQLYPDYNSFNGAGSGFMRAPIMKMTIGDYVVAQPGFLTSMNITVPDDSPWEIANDQGGDGVDTGKDNGVYQLPHVLDISCNFTLIHNFLPRRSWMVDAKQNTGEHITPLITPSNDNKWGIHI